ncbi:MAG: hypothetical protein ABSF93_10225, partial [Candidatus Sulfotelmatobacter sp.]
FSEHWKPPFVRSFGVSVHVHNGSTKVTGNGSGEQDRQEDAADCDCVTYNELHHTISVEARQLDDGTGDTLV